MHRSGGAGWGGERGEIEANTIKDCAQHGICMARKLYRQTSRLNNKVITPAVGGTRCFEVEPLDNDQVPSGYLEKVKVSIMFDQAELIGQGYPPQFTIYASGDAVNPDDIITAQSLNGSGTVWLSLKRTIRSDSSEPNRNDGQIDIWVDANYQVQCKLVCETWGRFVELSPA